MPELVQHAQSLKSPNEEGTNQMIIIFLRVNDLLTGAININKNDEETIIFNFITS